MVPTKKPKIAILSIKNSYNYGGVLSCLKVVYDFCEQYFEPTVFFLSFDPAISTSLRMCKFTSSTKPLSYFGMNCVEIGARWAFWEPGHYSFTYKTWKNILAEYNYFFVVSGTCIAAHPLIKLNKKFVLWVGTPYHNDREERAKRLQGIRYAIDKLAQKPMLKLEKSILSQSKYIWAISTYAQKHFEQIIGHKQNNLQLCGYPIDCSLSPQLSEKTKDNIILAVGRFSDPRKNIDMLMRVFELLHQKMPSVTLYIVGMKPAPEKLFDLSAHTAFNNIIFTGQVCNDDLKALYRRAKVLLITSYQEGLGIVGLEALLHGTPVVATACGGTKDYVIENVTGHLVAINDDEAMAQKTYSILTHTDADYHKLSELCQRFIKNNFSVDTTYTRFKEGLIATYPELMSTLIMHIPSSHKKKSRQILLSSLKK